MADFFAMEEEGGGDCGQKGPTVRIRSFLRSCWVLLDIYVPFGDWDKLEVKNFVKKLAQRIRCPFLCCTENINEIKMRAIHTPHNHCQNQVPGVVKCHEGPKKDSAACIESLKLEGEPSVCSRFKCFASPERHWIVGGNLPDGQGDTRLFPQETFCV